MNTNADKTNENKNQSVANASVQKQNLSSSNTTSVTNSPMVGIQNEIQKWANESPQVKNVVQLQTMIDSHVGQNRQNLIQKQTCIIKSPMLNHTSLNLENNNSNSVKPIQRIVIVGNQSVAGGIRAFVPLIEKIEFGEEITKKLNDSKAQAIFQGKNSAAEKYRIGWDEKAQDITYTLLQDGETIKEHEVKSGGDGGQQQRAGEASARASSLNKEDVKQKLTVDTHSNSRVFEHKEFLKEMGLKDGDNSGLIEFVKTKLSENPVTVDNRGCIVIQLTTTGTVVISPEGKIFHFGPGGK